MSQSWSNVSNTASIISIADFAIGSGDKIISFLGHAKDSEKTIERVNAELSPLRHIITRLQDKMQSPSACNIPLQADIMLACDHTRKTLEAFRKNIESWVGTDDNHSVESSLNVAFRHRQIEATMAQLANWRGIIELAMTASILAQGERQALETAHLEGQLQQLLRSADEQKQILAEAIASASEEPANDWRNLKDALEGQKSSAEALTKICNDVKSKTADIEANFGPVKLTEQAVSYTGIVGTPSGSIRHTYQGISASGDTFSIHSAAGSDDAIVRLAELHCKNLRQRGKEDPEREKS